MKLERIYKADQCTDLNDVEAAIEQTRTIIKSNDLIGKSNAAAYKRLNSLLKKQTKWKK